MLMTSLPCLLRHLFLNFVFIFSYETARLPRQSSGKDRHSVETSISLFFFIFIELFPPDGRPADSEPNRILRNFNRFVFFFGGNLNFKEN